MIDRINNGATRAHVGPNVTNQFDAGSHHYAVHGIDMLTATEGEEGNAMMPELMQIANSEDEGFGAIEPGPRRRLLGWRFFEMGKTHSAIAIQTNLSDRGRAWAEDDGLGPPRDESAYAIFGIRCALARHTENEGYPCPRKFPCQRLQCLGGQRIVERRHYRTYQVGAATRQYLRRSVGDIRQGPYGSLHSAMDGIAYQFGAGERP